MENNKQERKKNLCISTAMATVVGCVIGSGVFLKPQAVSYIHLDVYKRQLQYCVRENGSAVRPFSLFPKIDLKGITYTV